MRRLLAGFLATVGAGALLLAPGLTRACCDAPGAAAAADAQMVSDKGPESVCTLKVEGMTCGGCAGSAANATRLGIAECQETFGKGIRMGIVLFVRPLRRAIAYPVAVGTENMKAVKPDEGLGSAPQPTVERLFVGKTALVLCGGGSKGAMEVGFYRALVELGVQIDLIVGTSIGALNGAFIAAGGTPAELERIWRSVRPSELFRFNWQVLWKFKRADSLYSNAGIRAFLERHLSVRRFERLRIPLYVTATRLQTGETVYFDRGDLIEPLLASIALPGIFPPIERDGFQLMDGGLSDNVPITFAASKGARRAVFMLCVCCGRASDPVRGLDRVVSQAVSVMLDLKYRLDVQQFRNGLDLIALEPALGFDVSMLDFSHTDELIEGAYNVAMAELPGLLESQWELTSRHPRLAPLTRNRGTTRAPSGARGKRRRTHRWPSGRLPSKSEA